MTIGNMPIGGAQPPNAVIGGIMAAILAIATGLEPNAAVGLAIPFALLGQLGVTLVFTLMSPLMSSADNMAHNADTKGIERLNYFAMALLGLIFAVVVTLFFIAGATIGQTIASAIPTWLQTGLSAAGGMMRFVGFAVLLKVMMNRDMWGFFLMGFGLALITVANESLATPALLILALIGFGIAFWDFQQQTELKGAAVSTEVTSKMASNEYVIPEHYEDLTPAPQLDQEDPQQDGLALLLPAGLVQLRAYAGRWLALLHHPPVWRRSTPTRTTSRLP